MKITNKRVLLYYILNIFLVLNMMIILFAGMTMLQTGGVKNLGIFKFFLNTMFFTVISKGIIALIMRLPKKEQITMLLMSFSFAVFIALMHVLITIINPQIMLQLTLLFWGVYTILYNYMVLKNIRQFIPLVVLTSIYAFFSFALFIIMFMDIYKLFFEPTQILSGIISIIIVFVSLEMIQLLSYVFIPEYYSRSEITDLFDEIKIKYDFRERNIEEQEQLKAQQIVERKMIERQKQAERERLKQERTMNRRKLKAKTKPLTKSELNKHLQKMNEKKYKN